MTHLFNKAKKEKNIMALKLDLTKAYDSLEWNVIEETLIGFNFPPNFVKLIIFCITTPQISVLWNGEITSEFRPSRGIRQGDPMSSYIFVLCLERLSLMIEEKVLQKQWKPVKVEDKKNKGKVVVGSSSSLKWEAPNEGYIKINTDGAWMNSAISSGGGVLRRSDGTWYVGVSCKYSAVSPLAAELYALNDGLSIANDLRIKKVEVETIAQSLRTMLLTTGPNPHHELAAVVCDVAAVMGKFESVIITHVPREQNELAHKLAAFGKDMAVGYKTHYLVPECVHSVYEADLLHVAAARNVAVAAASGVSTALSM
ncbi:uncharacterized protein LOC110701593 [Chenopodium quinoa]|uniref:uncharacterized protein LOC110701593 n=1 Tax=Chenopodium quinoa TaxID=63459 RepID=UPI000B7995AB|nr:uncharacterized protein LOC110701593 [Chenopodium quinoa]